MTAWFICLVALVAVLRGAAMWRAWLALMFASIAGGMFNHVSAWVLIDLTAAIIVIFPPRAGFQKAIAALFGAMMLFELGWLWSAQMNGNAVVLAGAICGWLQLAALLTWGLHEQGRLHRFLDWVGGPWLAGFAVVRK